MGLVLELISSGDETVQLDPENTDGDSGAVRSCTGFPGLFSAGATGWLPFLDPSPAVGDIYRGGVLRARTGIVLPVFSQCADLEGVQEEIDFLDRITSPELGLSTLRVTNGTRVRSCYVYRTDFQAFYASPDSPEGAFGDLSVGQLATVLSFNAPSPYWVEAFATLASGDVADSDILTIDNPSGVSWGVYVEMYPLSGSGVAVPSIVNETTGEIFSSVATCDSTDVARVDWYGTHEDALSYTITLPDSTVQDVMSTVREFSVLRLQPGENVLRFSMLSGWHVSIKSTPRYTTP